MTNTWWTYLARISGGATGRDIARAVGATDAKVSYWKSGARMPSIAECIAAARAYGRPPLEGLVAVGYLDPDDVEGQVVVTPDIGAFSDKELADELLRRAASGGR